MTCSPADDVIARGRRAIVRRKRLRDAEDEFGWRSDAELARFDATRPVQVGYDNYQRNWSFDFRFTDTPGRSFAVEDENGVHIGNIMYYNIDTNRREAEVGISIGERDRWSQGYGADAMQALARVVLQRGQVDRLYLHTLDWNGRAQRAFEKAGFQVCGNSWRDGHTFILMELRRQQPAGVRAAVSA